MCGVCTQNGSVNVLACKILPESFQSMVNAGDHRSSSFNSMISNLLKQTKTEVIRFLPFFPLQFSSSIALHDMGELPLQGCPIQTLFSTSHHYDQEYTIVAFYKYKQEKFLDTGIVYALNVMIYPGDTAPVRYLDICLSSGAAVQ